MIRRIVIAVVIVAATFTGAPSANAEPSYDQLRGMLPQGVNPDSCHPDNDVRGDVIGLMCNDDIPGGPTGAQYLLYGNLQKLGGDFDHAVTTFQKIPCAEGQQAKAGRWAVDGKGQGLVFCFVNDTPGRSGIAWSKESSLFVASVTSPDLPSLWQWFQNVGMWAG